MSSTTKRWMKEELQKLLEQRERYQLAEATARDVAQARRRTTRLRAIDEEILGHREALASLEPAVRKTVHAVSPRRLKPTLVSPTIGATLAVMQPRPAVVASLVKVVGGSFAVGFAMTALLLVMFAPGEGDRRTARAHPATAAPVNAQQRKPSSPTVDTAVHAAVAEPLR